MLTKAMEPTSILVAFLPFHPFTLETCVYNPTNALVCVLPISKTVMKRWFHVVFRWFTGVRFGPRAEQTLFFALKEAVRLNHNYIGTEHVLLGLVKVEDGVASHVLQKKGISGDDVRSAVERYIGRGSARKITRQFAYTPRVKTVLGRAGKEARMLECSQIQTEHILLALLHEDKGIAARVLKNMGMTLEQTRIEVQKELDPNISPQ